MIYVALNKTCIM